MSILEAHVLLSEVTKSGMRYILMQRLLERMCVFCGHTIRPRSSKDLRPGTISLGPGSLPCHPNPNFHLSKKFISRKILLVMKNRSATPHQRITRSSQICHTQSPILCMKGVFFSKIELMEHVVDTYIPLKLQKFHC